MNVRMITIMVLISIILTHWSQKKNSRHFADDIFNFIVYHETVAFLFTLMTNWQYASINSDDDLSRNWQQAIILTDDGLIYWRIICLALYFFFCKLATQWLRQRFCNCLQLPSNPEKILILQRVTHSSTTLTRQKKIISGAHVTDMG